MKQGKMLYEGKAKRVYQTDDPDLFIQEFKDDATAFNAKKKGQIADKGVVNNKISSILFEYLEKNGVKTHFVKLLDERRMLVKKLEIILIEMTVRNITAGGISRQLGIKEGIVLKKPVLEYHYKSDELDDPLMNADHVAALGLATPEELKILDESSLKVNEALKTFFLKVKLNLVDFKLEFGRHKNQVLLGDEISPDTMRLWEVGTNRKMDKDRFRRDLGQLEETYQEVLHRVESS
jgi:phosphoribosylaminoimidazole-succinocarboxamide synthase